MLSAASLILVATLSAAFQQLPLTIARPYIETEVRDRRGVREVPANVALAATLQPVVDLMLRQSATFRRQCSRIGRTQGLAVTLQYGLEIGRSASGGTATTTVTRQPGGRIEAVVQLGTLDNHVELIAHEFEHILEQVDEVDLSAMASRPATGVRMVGAGGHFETERAIAIGRQVSDEVRNAPR